MRYELRKNQDGSEYFSFQYYENGKRIRLSKEEIRTRFGKDVTTEEEAKDCLKLLETQFELKKFKILKRVTWEKEFYSFAKLLDQYTEVQQKKAPNSWQNSVFYLKHYVLHYFLSELRLNNIELWQEHFEDFRNWLEHKATQTKNDKPLAWQSRNHCIKALNTFLKHLENKNVIDRAKKCPTFEEHLMNSRTIDDVVKPEEMEKVYQTLVEDGHSLEATLFRYLYFSGMRFNEALAVSLGDLFQGEIENEFMRKKLEAYKIDYHGYIVSDGQLDRVVDGKIVRAPFKGQKTISEKHNRIVPVIDKELWNALVEIGAKKHDEGKNPRDSALFEGIDDTTATRRLQEAFEKLNFSWRPWHCLRHSRATYLIGETGDMILARTWLGHTSPKTIERYNHLFQAITRAAKSKEATGGKKFGLKKV